MDKSDDAARKDEDKRDDAQNANRIESDEDDCWKSLISEPNCDRERGGLQALGGII